MGNIIELIAGNWHTHPCSDKPAIAEIEAQLAVKFPDDYVALLLWSNGGEAKIGTAYFQFWSVQALPARNISASITKYMTARFVGIGTNGGGECYGLDYTNGAVPTFAIVPLGDLCNDSKFLIAPSLTAGLEQAIAGKFDDGEYNALPGKYPSDELMHIKMTNIRMTADRAWQNKDYQQYVKLLEGVKDAITSMEEKKLKFAQSRI